MKKILYAAGLIVGCVLCSCSNDDGNKNRNNTPELTIFKISEWIAPQEQDLDNDGDASANLITEYDCFDNWRLVLNEDGTYMRTYNTVNIVNGNLTCISNITGGGTWERDGQILTITDTVSGNAVSTYTYSANDYQLTYNGPGSYPNRNGDGLTIETGTISLIYTKDETATE